ncbi:MAG: RDD family protein [bacterium]
MQNKNSEVAETSTNEKSSEEKSESPISGFWIRIFAFLIDGLVIGAFGLIIGLIFRPYLIQMGAWGRLLGFLIAIMYFGVQNSVICQGQTIGKRITKIRVVNKNGKSISIGRSTCRSAILSLPYFLNGALIPPSITDSIFGVVLILVIFGGLICPVYLYIFNRKTRQSLHDLVCKTYVVKARLAEPIAIGSVSRIHYVIVVLVFIGILISSIVLGSKPSKDRQYLDILYDAVNEIENSTPAGVSIGTATGPKGSNRYVAARVTYQTDPGDLEAASEQIAEAILATNPPISRYDDFITVTALYGFDIGIASSWRWHVEGLTPAEWEERLRKKGVE